MILLVGQVARETTDREAFQEIDYRHMFGTDGQVGDPDRGRPPHSRADQPGLPSRDERPTRAGRGRAAGRHAGRRGRGRRRRPLQDRARRAVGRRHGDLARPARAGRAADGHRRRRRLERRRLQDIRAFVEANGLPVCASFRNPDLFDNRHPNYVGDLGVGVGPALGKRLKACDLIIAVGPRLGEATTGGYTLFDLPIPKQKLVHVHAERRGARPRLSGDPADQLRHAGLRGGRQGDEAGRRRALEGLRHPGPRRVSRQHQARPAARRGQHGRGHRLAEQAPARRRDRHQRRGQLRGVPASLLPVSRLQDPARADQRRDGLRRAGGGRGQDRRSRPHGRRRWRATAAS